MKRTILTALALLLAVLGLSVTASPANAHTPTISASCDGVTLKATAYDGNRANTWTVTINGSTQSGTFGASYSNTFPVPQGGTTSTWSARIKAYNGSYDSGTKSGTVGPCGTVPKDASAAVSVTAPTCDTGATLVYGSTSHASLSGTPDGTTGPANYSVTATAQPGHQFANGETTLTFTGSLDGKRVEQECFTQPPADHETRTLVDDPNCRSRTVTTRTQERTRTYSWDGTTYVAGAWTTWKTVKTTATTATQRECPLVKVRGSVKRIDKCRTSGDLFRLDRVRGGEYVVNGKVRAEGKWLRTRGTRNLRIKFRPSANKFTAVGKTSWRLHFTNAACPTPPSSPPNTGA